MRKKKTVEPVEIRFKNSPEEILNFETFDQVCLDIAAFMRIFDKNIKKIADRHGVRLTGESYFTLENSK